jgi:nitrate reductase gamma subunit
LDRVKAITTWSDYLFLSLAAAPFVTGFFAYHEVFENYRLIISLHILSGELMLMTVPFTKFVHMIYSVIIRLTVVSEYSLGRGNRTW